MGARALPESLIQTGRSGQKVIASMTKAITSLAAMQLVEQAVFRATSITRDIPSPGLPPPAASAPAANIPQNQYELRRFGPFITRDQPRRRSESSTSMLPRLTGDGACCHLFLALCHTAMGA